MRKTQMSREEYPELDDLQSWSPVEEPAEEERDDNASAGKG
jgi:hypothetical protein